MVKIKNIVWGVSENGNAGCNNGNYDIPVDIVLDNHEKLTVRTCRCGCSCSGSFAVNRFAIGMTFPFVDSIIEYGYKE